MVSRTLFVVAALAALLALPGASLAHRPRPVRIVAPGLERPVEVIRDQLGVPHVFAKSSHDAYFAVGYLHAEDRLFQMDSSRRQASGTLAELLGSSALASDAQLRTFGLRGAAARARWRSSRPRARRSLEAYAKGVNAWLAANPLPSEYAALELTKAQVPAWTALDSAAITKLLAFGLSFDLGDLTNTQRLHRLPDGRRGARLRRAQAVLRGRQSQRAVRARAVDPARRDLAAGARATARHSWSTLGLDRELGEAAEQALDKAKRAGVPVEQASEQRLERLGRLGEEVGEPQADGRERPAPCRSARRPTFYEIGHRRRRPAQRAADALRRHLPRRAGRRPRHERRTSRGARRSTRRTSPTSTRSSSSSQAACRSQPRTRATRSRRRSSRRRSAPTSRATAPPTTSSWSRRPPASPPRRSSSRAATTARSISVTGTTGLSVQFTGFSATREIDFFRLLARGGRRHGGDRRAAVLRLRRAELDVRRRQRQHRLQDERRDPAPRGPPGRHGGRTAAVLHPERNGRQRVDRRPDPGRGPGASVRGAAVRGDGRAGQPGVAAGSRTRTRTRTARPSTTTR